MDHQRRADSWRVELGEEAKIESQTDVSSMLQLSNGMIAVASIT